MKTLLIKPNAKKRQYGNTEVFSAIEPPLWLAIMANLYENSNIIDMEAENITENEVEIVDKINEIKPDKIIILATGSHPSAHIQQKEAAERLKVVTKLITETEIQCHLNFNPIEAGNPRWDLLKMGKYRAHNWHRWGQPNNIEGYKDNTYGVIYSSVNCPYNCEFCCVKDFYQQKYKKREPSDVLKDVTDLVRKYDINNIKMMDELFALPTDHNKEVCNLLEKTYGDILNIWAYARIDTVTEESLKYMRKAGIRWLAYGIESGNEEIRKKSLKGKFNNAIIEDVIKMTKDAGINVVGNYMFGFWEEDISKMLETLHFAKKLNCEYSNFYCMVAYPGSKLYNEMKKRGVELPEDSSEYAQMSPNFKPLPTKHLIAEEVLKFRDNAFLNYYTGVKYLTTMKEKFGKEVINNITNMIDTPLQRRKR